MVNRKRGLTWAVHGLTMVPYTSNDQTGFDHVQPWFKHGQPWFDYDPVIGIVHIWEMIAYGKALTDNGQGQKMQYGPRREKTCLRGFRQSEFQTSLSYRDSLEN